MANASLSYHPWRVEIGRNRGRPNFRHNLTQVIVPILIGVTFISIRGGQCHVESLSGTRKMDPERARTIGQLHNVTHESFHLFTDHEVLVPVKESMGEELDELPLRPALDCDVRAAPA